MKHPTLIDTLNLIQKAHAGQKYNDMPYWEHPLRVMLRLPPEATEEERHAALLHDVIEDTIYQPSDLKKMGYSDRVLDLVDKVTMKGEGSYLEKIKGIIDSGDIGAIRLKYADMSENSDPRNLAQVTEERRAHYMRKYSQPLRMLKEALDQHQSQGLAR
jgi:(p)ppGpp synthase/HD superfamily hydrolase